MLFSNTTYSTGREMGAEFSQEPESLQQQQEREQQQQQQRPESQPQQQVRPQSQSQQQLPEAQPQQQLRPQQQQPQPKQPQQQPQPLTLEGTSSRESWILPPYGEAKPSQSLTPPVKPSKELINFPHNYEEILKDADSQVDKSSREKLLDQLYAGVFLDHKTKKYWLEKRSSANCFMLYARALSITWAENQHYWKWVSQKEASGTITEVAELKRVCWLEVQGKFDTRKLSPGILYQVSFIVMLKDPAQGWEVPVNVRLVLPGGKKQQRKENLLEKLRVRWIEIPVGEFVASEQDTGEMEFSMYEYEGGMWKQGLVIKGVAINPKQLS